MGVNKVLMSVKSINWKEMKDIGIQLKDDDGVNGLTANWADVERV